MARSQGEQLIEAWLQSHDEAPFASTRGSLRWHPPRRSSPGRGPRSSRSLSRGAAAPLPAPLRGPTTLQRRNLRHRRAREGVFCRQIDPGVVASPQASAPMQERACLQQPDESRELLEAAAE